jgi:hypothetical protein
LERALNEAQFQRQVTDLATLLGWSWYHTHDSRRSPAGFPDLVLWRDRVVFAELKTDKGRTSVAQMNTCDGLTIAGAEVHVWRPRDFPDVKAVLERRAA